MSYQFFISLSLCAPQIIHTGTYQVNNLYTFKSPFPPFNCQLKMKKKIGIHFKACWNSWKFVTTLKMCGFYGILHITKKIKNKNPINNLYIRVLLKIGCPDTFKARLRPYRKKSHWSKKDANGAICRVLVWLKRRFNFCHFFPLRRTK